MKPGELQEYIKWCKETLDEVVCCRSGPEGQTCTLFDWHAGFHRDESISLTDPKHSTWFGGLLDDGSYGYLPSDSRPKFVPQYHRKEIPNAR